MADAILEGRGTLAKDEGEAEADVIEGADMAEAAAEAEVS
jgi:hypothetical protein